MSLTRLMNVAVAAVVEMLGTWRNRMAFICTPIANAIRPTRAKLARLGGEYAIQTARKTTCGATKGGRSATEAADLVDAVGAVTAAIGPLGVEKEPIGSAAP